jgi:hypothetical protein
MNVALNVGRHGMSPRWDDMSPSVPKIKKNEKNLKKMKKN